MLKDGWVLVLQRRGQAKFIISNSHPYNQIKHKGSNSVFPDVPPSPSRAEGSSPLPQRRSHKPPSLQIQLMLMHVAISIPPTWERQYPSSSHPTGLGDTQLASHPSWSFSPGSAGEMLSFSASIPGWGGTSGELPPAPGTLRWYPERVLQMFAHKMQGKKHLVSSTQPNRARPSRNNHRHVSAHVTFPSTRAFVLKT